MSEDIKVQFVCFETVLDKEQFIKRWELYKRSVNSDADVTLQQSEKEGVFTYVAQHRFKSEEIQFVFSKENRPSRIAQELIRATKAGGYSLLQAERLQDAAANESKVFVFLTDPGVNLNAFKDLSGPGKLNIYQPYYENCKYAYILEYFMKSKFVAALMEQLKPLEKADAGIYKDCKLVKNKKADKQESFYVWPSV